MRRRRCWICGLVVFLLGAAVFLAAYYTPARPRSAMRRPAKPPTTATAAPTASPPAPPVCPFADRFKGYVGIYAKNLETGRTYTLNADQVFAAASTIKVPVSVVMYQQFYDQADFWDQIAYDVGVELMMLISDNEYFAVFLDEIEEKIGPEKIRVLFADLGMTSTTIRDAKARELYGYSNITTARDMAVLFERLYRGGLIRPEKRDFMLDAMAHSIFPDEMARYLQDRRVMHKIGDLDDVLADVGIVEGPGGPVLISIFTETRLEQDYASDYIAAISACLYTALSGNSTSWSGEFHSPHDPDLPKP